MMPIGATISTLGFSHGKGRDRLVTQAALEPAYSVKSVCNVAAS